MSSKTERNQSLLYPALRDPRWVILAFLLSFVGYAISSPGFHRSATQFALGVGTCVLLDGVLSYYRRRTLMFPMSGLVSSMGLLLLTDSPLTWVYPAIGAVAILSKHFIHVRGRHIFNPLNFGVVVALLFLSSDVTVVAARWGGSTAIFAAVVGLGVFAAHRARRLDVGLAYVAGFGVGVLLRAWLLGAPLPVLLIPMTGAAFALFSFFMITDPMTTPESRQGRILYGIAIAALDTGMRLLEVRNAPYYSLFLMSGFLPFFRERFRPAVPENVWKFGSIPVGRRPSSGPMAS